MSGVASGKPREFFVLEYRGDEKMGITSKEESTCASCVGHTHESPMFR